MPTRYTISVKIEPEDYCDNDFFQLTVSHSWNPQEDGVDMGHYVAYDMAGILRSLIESPHVPIFDEVTMLDGFIDCFESANLEDDDESAT